MKDFELDGNAKLVRTEGPAEWEIDLTTAEGRLEAHLRYERDVVGYLPVYADIKKFMLDVQHAVTSVGRMKYERDYYFQAWKQATSEPSSGDRIYELTVGKTENQVIKVGAIRDAYFERNKQLELDCG